MIKTEQLIKENLQTRQSHINLKESCIERGGNSNNHRGVLAQYLNTDIPKGFKVLLCHACHNGKCSNPKHLYWGTPKENMSDAITNGTHSNSWVRAIAKYGEEEARRLWRNRRNAGDLKSPTLETL